MSYNRVFSQPAFWDFVSGLRGDRDNADRQAYRPLDAGSVDRPRRARGGPGRRNRNRHGMNPSGPTTVAESTPSTFAGDEKDREMPPAYPMQTGAAPITSENEKTATDATPLNGGKKRGGGPGGFRKLRMRLRDEGFSEEEIAARVERRRARRAARANGEAVGQGPRARRMRKVAEADPLNSEGEKSEGEKSDGEKRGLGPRGHGNKRRNGNGLGPRVKRARSADAADASSSNEEVFDAEKTVAATGERCGRGVRFAPLAEMAPMPLTPLEKITKGGPRKFAGRFNKQGANPSNGNEHDGCASCGPNPEGYPKHRSLRSGMRGLEIDNAESGNADATPGNKTERKLNKKMNKKQDGTKKHGRKDGKSFTPRADVFATAGSYIIHVPVPGAKQEDVGVTWEPEKSVIRIAGVVHRPDLESLGKECTLVRGQRIVGPFERKVKLGNKSEAVKIYENGVTATLEDGILSIEVPKYDGVVADDTEGEDGFVTINEKV